MELERNETGDRAIVDGQGRLLHALVLFSPIHWRHTETADAFLEPSLASPHTPLLLSTLISLYSMIPYSYFMSMLVSVCLLEKPNC